MRKLLLLTVMLFAVCFAGDYYYETKAVIVHSRCTSHWFTGRDCRTSLRLLDGSYIIVKLRGNLGDRGDTVMVCNNTEGRLSYFWRAK